MNGVLRAKKSVELAEGSLGPVVVGAQLELRKELVLFIGLLDSVPNVDAN